MSNQTRAVVPAGNIYDLGYRHYDGKRHGRWYAAWSLYVESMRGVWGFGRPMAAKAAPFILLGLYAFPALIQLAFSSVIATETTQGGARLFAYDNYYNRVGFFILLFLVAQAPELLEEGGLFQATAAAVLHPRPGSARLCHREAGGPDDRGLPCPDAADGGPVHRRRPHEAGHSPGHR